MEGKTICQATARGKAILTRFSNGLTLNTHNQLYGRWLITTDGEYPDAVSETNHIDCKEMRFASSAHPTGKPSIPITNCIGAASWACCRTSMLWPG
jgi:formamidopyrimidine-DNA glycosylase